MTTRNKLAEAAFVATVFGIDLFSAVSAFADNLYVQVEETGGDVVFRYSGSLDLTGAETTNYFIPVPNYYIDPAHGEFANFGEMSTVGYRLFGSVLPIQFGAGKNTASGAGTGDHFFLRRSGEVLLPSTYASQDPIAGALTFPGTTLEALGVDTTPFSYSMPGGVNTLRFFQRPPSPDVRPVTPLPVPTSTSAKPDLQVGRTLGKLKGNDIYRPRKAGSKQTLVLNREIFVQNKSKAFVLMQNDGRTVGEFSLEILGDELDGLKASVILIGGGNVTAELKSGLFKRKLAAGVSAAILYRVRTKKFFAGVLRNGSRHDQIDFRMKGGGETDVASMVNHYRESEPVQ